MIRSKSIDVTAAANAEQLEDFIVGPEGKAITVTEMWFEQAAAVRLRGYLDGEQIVDVSGECDAALTNGVPVQVDVPTGRTWKAGFLDQTGSGVTLFITVFYEEK